MHIALVLIAALISSVQFLFNSKYQQKEGTGIEKTLIFSFIMSFFQMLFTLAVSFKRLEFSVFSLCFATVGAIIAIVFYYMSIKVLEKANLMVYSLFSMMGKMLLPSLFYIIFFGEDCTIQKIISAVLVVVALIIGNPREKNGKKAREELLYYTGVFVLSGLAGILEKYHQISVLSVNTDSYVFLVGCVMFVLSGAILLGYRAKGVSLKLASPKKSTVFVMIYAALMTVSSILLLLSMSKVDASLQFPLLSGGTIVFSLLIDLIVGKKPRFNNIIGAAIAFLAVIILSF